MTVCGYALELQNRGWAEKQLKNNKKIFKNYVKKSEKRANCG